MSQTFAPFRLGLVGLFALTTILAACGGGGSDKKVAADDWVSELCDIAADFQDASDEAGEEFEDADFDDTKEAKEAFADSVKAQREAQKDFRSAFDDLGQPDIEGGDDVIKAFEEQFEENNDLTDEIEDAIADIDDDDDFLEAFLEIAADIDEPDFREKLAELAEDNDDVQDLIDEIDDDEDCSATIFEGDSPDELEEPTTTSTGPTRTPVVGNPTRVSGTPLPANTPNEKWVVGICSGFGEWVKDIEKANTTFQAELDKNRTGGESAAIKKLLVDFLKLSRTETVSLRTQVTGLKAPEVKDGPAIHKVFVDATGDLVKVFDTLVSDAEKISTASRAQTVIDVDLLATRIDTAFDEVIESFDALDSFEAPAIENLFDTRPECREL